MNVSMMDSYNLAWKLIYSIYGLTPDPEALLDTYHSERHTIAQQLIDFDRTFSSMFSGQMGSEDGNQGLTHEEFQTVFSTGNGFTSGCGIEYPESLLVSRTLEKEGKDPIQGTDRLSGMLYPGRRLLNVQVKRHADGNRRDLQDGALPAPQKDFMVTNNHRLPLNRPLPHPLLSINRPPRLPGHFPPDPNNPRLLHHPPLPTLRNRTSRPPPAFIPRLHLARRAP